MSEIRRPGLFSPPPPEARLVEDPYRERWRPRRAVVGEDGDEILPQRPTDGARTDLPAAVVEVTAEPEEGGGSGGASEPLELPDVPPLQPGEPDDLRLANPDRWAPPGDRGLPAWFWVVAVLVAVGLGLWIVWGVAPRGYSPGLPADFEIAGEGE